MSALTFMRTIFKRFVSWSNKMTFPAGMTTKVPFSGGLPPPQVKGEDQTST